MKHKKVNQHHYKKVVRILLLLFLMHTSSSYLLSGQTSNSYSFIVAGHTYGSHTGGNIGLHPNFLNSLDACFDTLTRFFVLTGDMVNNSTVESWEQVEMELTKYGLPYYYVMGNHDANAIGNTVFEEKFGNTYYTFDYRHERYIILNSTEQDRSISPNQMVFLKDCLDIIDDSISTVFIFFHELLWNSLEKYKGVLANSRSRYAQIKDYSNYWEEVHPLLELYPEKNFYVLAGDVGGNTDAIAAFYDKWDNITLLASGMGEVPDENYLLVTVNEDGSVGLKLIPLNVGVTMNAIEYYSVPISPEFIVGDTLVSPDLSYEYSVTDVFNADSYNWKLPTNTSGASTNNSIQVMFDSGFTTGTISVSASSKFFGSSSPALKTVSTDGTYIAIEKLQRLEINVNRNNFNHILEITTGSTDDFQIEVYNIDGKKIYSNQIRTIAGIKKQLELPVLSNNIYFVNVTGNQVKKVKKIVVW